MCVTVTGSNGEVGGLQLNLTWDASCIAPAYAADDAAECVANPSTGKSVQTRVLTNGMRVLFLSLTSVSPVPDGELFCCQFTLISGQHDQCCSVRIDNLILASPAGERVYDPGISVEALVGNTPCAASPPSGPPRS